MDPKKIVFAQTGIVALGQVICVGAMLSVFALLGYFDYTVLLGGIIGAVVATGNFFFMATGISLAADKAQEQDVKGGKALVKGSYLIRILVMLVILFACAKSGLCNPIALVLPLVFVRPTLTIAEFFRKKGA